MPPGRNESCHCGSGKKYKRCCLDTDRAAAPVTNSSTTASSESLFTRLLEIQDLPTFELFLGDHPELLGEEMLRHVDEMQADPIVGTTMTAQANLLHSAGENPRAAWETYERAIAASTEIGEELDRERIKIDAAIAEQRADDVIAIADAAIPRAHEAGLMLMVSLFYESRGKGLMQLTRGDRAANLEAAIASYEEAGRRAAEEGHRAEVHMHLGLAYRERIRGDRAQNLERALFFLRDSLSLLDDSTPPEIWAIVRTNLASTLLLGDRGDRVADLREAANLCRAALAYRTPQRDATDWAYTQLNLGAILQDLALLGDGDLSDAEAVYRKVIGEARRVPGWMQGTAHCDLGRLLRISTNHDDEEQMAMVESPQLLERTEREDRVVLESARQHFDTGLPLTEDDWFPIRRGRALSEYVAVLARLEFVNESIAAGEEALAILRPTSAPGECMRTARALASQLADRGEWSRSVDAWRDAVEAAELSFHGWLDTDARQRQMGEAGELARWASFALAQVDEDIEAAIVLEAGRTREIRRRVGLTETEAARLDQLPDELRNAFLSATAALSTSALGDAGAGRQLQEILAQIREFPEMDDFGTMPDIEHLVSAVEPDWPVLYINPAPWGTLLLKLAAAGERVEVETMLLEYPTSLEVLGRLAAGDAIDDAEPTADASSYLLGAGAVGTADLKQGLEQALPWLGETVAKPVAEWLQQGGAAGVTLIPCGPIGAAPLHAAPWDTGKEKQCLLDSFTVRYAPSALLAALARERAVEREGLKPNLLALADPGQNLPAAGPEVAVIARNFGGNATIASGPDATSDFLRANLAGVTHLHFSCHAAGGHFDPSEAGILLADGFLPAQELTALTGVDARVAVISACQSALPQIIESPNEVFATSTVLLAAGSACAIAALWAVWDLPTAMLMTRLYEGMFAGCPPPEALRRAQLWLRGLSYDEKDAFLDAHPELAAEYRRRGPDAPHTGGRRRPAPTAGIGPFSHPEYWAPFIAVGA